jgi:uncharacterized membrane protein YciS (DUF1049 family)
VNALAKVLWAVLAIIVFLFALLAVNQDPIALRFLNWRTPELSVFWWLLVAFAVGALFSAVLFGIAALKLRMRQRSLNRELQESRRELERLRDRSALPGG